MKRLLMPIVAVLLMLSAMLAPANVEEASAHFRPHCHSETWVMDTWPYDVVTIIYCHNHHTGHFDSGGGTPEGDAPPGGTDSGDTPPGDLGS